MNQLIEGIWNTVKAMFEWLFECHHNTLSRVFTIKRRTYQVCLDCGEELEYSLSLMHSIPSNKLDHVYACKNADRGVWSAQTSLAQRL